MYESIPCGSQGEPHPTWTMPPRIFNQVSYLHFDRYSTAEFLVTIDSDCIIQYYTKTPKSLKAGVGSRGLLQSLPESHA